MKEFALNGSLRTETGKKASKQLRKDDTVPAVLYGGEKNILFSVAEKDLKKLIYTPDVFIVNLTINKKPYKAIIKELQFHPVTDRVLHLDFLQVFEDKNLTIALPVKLEGSAEGVKQGGRLNLITRKLRVCGLIKDLPENITINITDLALGDSREVSDLEFDNFEIVDPKTT
ncbi:MAG: 50S ribosomal protein L25, partial [Bacteroidales bacterium]|nr:50S ribosomal protein L25 [Bacteroidales bacterium]